MIKTSLGQHLLKKYNCRSCRNCRNLQIYSLFLGSVQIYPVFSIHQTYILIGYSLFKLKLIEGIEFENKADSVFE